MIRVLVVDDSAYSRQTIKSMLESTGEIEVVDVATDGDEALKLAESLRPDVITLDLEMPRIDGFTFLRILTYRSPLPVIVVSSYASRADVLRALDLGALDFVAKPSKTASKALWSIKRELVTKVREAASARLDLYLADSQPEEVTGFHSISDLPNIETETQPITIPPLPSKSVQIEAPQKQKDFDTEGLERPQNGAGLESGAPAVAPSSSDPLPVGPPDVDGVLLIGASTGGPRAFRKVLRSLAFECPWPIAVVQHMPPRFTREFAIRLSRKLDMDVKEAADGAPLLPGRVLIAPGGFHMTLAKNKRDASPVIRLRHPSPYDRYVPSVNRLFASAPKVFGSQVVAMVLTGMGNDGTEGARAIRYAGGKVLAEDRSTAVVFGMPQKAIQSGVVDVIAPLETLSASVRWLVAQLRKNR